jgi:hypothetical protein
VERLAPAFPAAESFSEYMMAWRDHVHGHEAVRVRDPPMTMVSPHVEPMGFHRAADGAIVANIRQSIRDLEGKPLQGQTHGLKDKTAGHVFRRRAGKVARFDIQMLHRT